MHSHTTVAAPAKQQVLITKLPINSMVVIRDSQQAVAMVVKVTTISIPQVMITQVMLINMTALCAASASPALEKWT